MTVLIAGELVRGSRTASGWLEVDGDHVTGVGWGSPPRTPDERHDGLIARGLVDLQVNGAAGVEVTDGASALDRIDALLLARGVTSYLATIPTTDDETAARAAAEIAERVSDPASPVEGMHLEGPFLSAAYAGVHRPQLLRGRVGDDLPSAYGSPALRLVTLAPELPGALELITRLRRRGVTVAIGHTGCDAVTAQRALDAGARLVTHVFNAMAPLHHRRPGPAGVGLTDPRARVGVIADGRHVDPLVLELIRRVAGGRVVLVSDACAAAGAPPGEYSLAGVPIMVAADGSATTASGVLAGGTVTLDEVVRRWWSLTGASLPAAIAAAGERPARLIGLPASPRPGAWADLVLMRSDGHVARTMRRGRWTT